MDQSQGQEQEPDRGNELQVQSAEPTPGGTINQKSSQEDSAPTPRSRRVDPIQIVSKEINVSTGQEFTPALPTTPVVRSQTSADSRRASNTPQTEVLLQLQTHLKLEERYIHTRIYLSFLGLIYIHVPSGTSLRTMPLLKQLGKSSSSKTSAGELPKM
jgi:hypothetical protein